MVFLSQKPYHNYLISKQKYPYGFSSNALRIWFLYWIDNNDNLHSSAAHTVISEFPSSPQQISDVAESNVRQKTVIKVRNSCWQQKWIWCLLPRLKIQCLVHTFLAFFCKQTSSLIIHLFLLGFCSLSIQHIVLCREYNIDHKSNIGQLILDWVLRQYHFGWEAHGGITYSAHLLRGTFFHSEGSLKFR